MRTDKMSGVEVWVRKREGLTERIKKRMTPLEIEEDRRARWLARIDRKLDRIEASVDELCARASELRELLARRSSRAA